MRIREFFYLSVVVFVLGNGLLSADGETPPMSERRTPLVEQVSQRPALDDAGRKIERVYYDAHNVFSETNLFSDVNNGFYKTYHRNGQLRSEVRYQQGWQVYDKAFDETGKPVFRHGEVRDHYANGPVLSEIVQYKDDRKHGPGKYFYYDGKTVVDVWHYMNGRQVGIHTRNNADGSLRYTEDWGYPSWYVERLKKMILFLSVLSGVLLLAMLSLFFINRRNSQQR